MLLIHPPVAKASEPPAGIARLAGALAAHGIPCRLLDANLEGLLYLLEQPVTASDTWSRRAGKHLAGNLAALRDPATYRSADRYARAVRDINRVLALSAQDQGATVGLADYQQRHLSPLRSDDLLSAAAHPEQNPFYPYFSARLGELLDSSCRSDSAVGLEPSCCAQCAVAGDGSPIVGFSLNYLSQALTTFAMIGYLRQRFPGIRIILGGGLVTSWLSHDGWRNPFGTLVDHLLAGPGESFLLALHCVTDAGRNSYLPDYSQLPLDQYLAPGLVLPYSAASGCYWNSCTFCPERAEGNAYCPVPVVRVQAELATLVAETKPALLHLLDNAISPALLQALVERSPGVPWYGFARIANELASVEFCRALRRSGCVMLKLGLESGDQRVLDALCKGIDIGTASQVLHNLRQVGIKVYLYLLFGTPAETLSSARTTLEFVVRHHAEIGFLNLALFNMPVCGTLSGEHATALFYDGDLSLYTGFRHPQGWERKQVRQFLDREFKRHPAVAAIIRNDPPFFTSNHAPFFAGQ